MSNVISGKSKESFSKHGDIKHVTNEERRNYLVSEPNYHTTKAFSENVLTIQTKSTPIFINNSVYLCLSILEIDKIVMYEI